MPRDIPQEPAPKQERRVTLTEPWPLPAVVVAHPITFDGHPDSYPLHIASKILSDGQSSRIYRKLVYEKQIALAAFGQGNIIEDPNLFFAVAIVQPGQFAGRGREGAQRASSTRLKTEGVTAEELDRAKNQFARDYILGRESNQQKALHLGHAVGHPRRHQDRGWRIRHLHEHDAADVQRVAKTYFTPKSRLIIHVMPKGASSAGSMRTTDRAASRVSRLCAALSPFPALARAQTWPRSARRARSRRARSKFPPYAIKTLSNGLQVLVVSHHEQPAVSLRLLVRAGAVQDPTDKPGVASLAATLLDQGTDEAGSQRAGHRPVDRSDRRRARRGRRQRT